LTNNEQKHDELDYWIDLEKAGVNLEKNSAFLEWLNKDELNKKLFNDEKKFFEEINSLPNDFLNEIKNEVKDNRKNANKSKQTIFYFGSFASAACLLLVAYFSIFFDNTTFTHTYIASQKVQNKITLPDNSVISLDANTQIKVKFYDDRREIFLTQGKAFFDVFPNKKRPFIVNTDNTTIKVLGTKFEVVNNKKFELNVKEGRVSISNKKDKLLAFVTKNQSLKLNKYYQIDSIIEKNSQDMALWSEGKFEFRQTSIKDVLKTFRKYININVKIIDKNIEDLKISGNFTSEEFDKIIANLPLIHPVIIEKEDNQIIIKRKINI